MLIDSEDLVCLKEVKTHFNFLYTTLGNAAEIIRWNNP